MRVIHIHDGHGTVEVRGRRAAVRLHGTYCGRIVKTGGRWAVPGTGRSFRSPADAGEELTEAAAA